MQNHKDIHRVQYVIHRRKGEVVRFIIDRFEGQLAVAELESKNLINIPREILPVGTKEGTVINIEIDYEETKKREDGIKRLMDDLWK